MTRRERIILSLSLAVTLTGTLALRSAEARGVPEGQGEANCYDDGEDDDGYYYTCTWGSADCELEYNGPSGFCAFYGLVQGAQSLGGGCSDGQGSCSFYMLY